MSRELIAHIADRYAFDSSPAFADLGAYHVKFDDLVPGARVEGTLATAVRRGERAVILADSGSGKSSVIADVLGPTQEGLAPIVIPIRFLDDSAARPLAVASVILATIPNYIAEVADVEGTAAAASAFRRVTHDRSFHPGIGLSLGWLRGELAGGLSEQITTESLVTITEKDAALEQVFERIHRAGLQPVIVFDDTDSWIVETDAATITGFMRDTVKWLSQFSTSVVVAAHRRYLDSPERRLEFLDTPVELPRIGGPAGLSAILARRVSLNAEGLDGPAPGISEALSEDAVDALYDAYVGGAPLRRVVQLTHMALDEVVNAQGELITADHILAAQRRGV